MLFLKKNQLWHAGCLVLEENKMEVHSEEKSVVHNEIKQKNESGKLNRSEQHCFIRISGQQCFVE